LTPSSSVARNKRYVLVINNVDGRFGIWHVLPDHRSAAGKITIADDHRDQRQDDSAHGTGPVLYGYALESRPFSVSGMGMKFTTIIPMTGPPSSKTYILEWARRHKVTLRSYPDPTQLDERWAIEFGRLVYVIGSRGIRAPTGDGQSHAANKKKV